MLLSVELPSLADRGSSLAPWVLVPSAHLATTPKLLRKSKMPASAAPSQVVSIYCILATYGASLAVLVEAPGPGVQEPASSC